MWIARGGVGRGAISYQGNGMNFVGGGGWSRAVAGRIVGAGTGMRATAGQDGNEGWRWLWGALVYADMSSTWVTPADQPALCMSAGAVDRSGTASRSGWCGGAGEGWGESAGDWAWLCRAPASAWAIVR